MPIGENVQKIRNTQGLTQSELANLVGVSQPMVAQIERGSKEPSIALANALASALGVSLMDIIDQQTTSDQEQTA